ncbi:hypothetical protein DMN91_000516 [Ooceraea biroi]|uniref:Uncharacterized protein n=1 Tax=Ooceraea biroi TaxID=2015173 RepID=A0A3L8E3D2_OOCBI|nr:hypothetical protein DMN91_000516 [Ooceraea biroi]
MSKIEMRYETIADAWIYECHSSRVSNRGLNELVSDREVNAGLLRHLINRVADAQLLPQTELPRDSQSPQQRTNDWKDFFEDPFNDALSSRPLAVYNAFGRFTNSEHEDVVFRCSCSRES